ncbi:glutaminase [Bacilli bacterium PM5-3]|nr:glutaminase [Bacilli bacterium PM5-3]
MQELLESIYNECLPYTKKGKTADYIPELAKVNPDLFGACVITNDGTTYGVGDYQKKFTIQSVSKVLILIQAFIDSTSKAVLEKVTLEPTSSSFNSIVNLELKNDNKPLNPFINAGAIVTTSFISGDTADEKVDRFLSLIRRITGNNDINVNMEVFESENRTGSRNRALAYFMNSTGTLEDRVEMILEAYFKICSIEVTCEDLAKIALTIARNGVNLAGEQMFDARNSKRLRAVMSLCGMYDGSGDFAVKVGLPSKSGVGGGIMSVAQANNGMGLAVFGPALDEKGNSYAGRKFLEKISDELDLSIF